MSDLEADRCEMRELSGSDSSRVEMVARYDRWAARCKHPPVGRGAQDSGDGRRR